ETATFGAGEANETTLTSAGSYDIFVAKYAPSGALLWAKQAGGTSSAWGDGIATDGSGNSLVTGSFEGTATFGAGEANETSLTSAGGPDIFVAKYASSGALLWAKQAGGADYDEGEGIAIDGSGNCLVTGFFEGTATFGAGEANETTLTSAGNFDIFVAKYAPSGALLWAKQAGGIYSDQGYGLAIDGSGNCLVTGSFEGTATFGAGANQTPLTSAGGDDIFVAKYGKSATQVPSTMLLLDDEAPIPGRRR
ncbi:MAG: SBBP repeat-containing protein, partial [Thermodesulfobacteriota bacterium]|nr:SBBP repeat-containing protein [Thermodesulfobacteriota bacterium]